MTRAAKNLAVQPAISDREKTSSAPSSVDGNLTNHQRDTAQYVADMILEMRNLAKAARLHSISVPLEYAYYEAFSIANRVEVPAEELERVKQLEKAAKEAAGE